MLNWVCDVFVSSLWKSNIYLCYILKKQLYVCDAMVIFIHFFGAGFLEYFIILINVALFAYNFVSIFTSFSVLWINWVYQFFLPWNASFKIKQYNEIWPVLSQNNNITCKWISGCHCSLKIYIDSIEILQLY